MDMEALDACEEAMGILACRIGKLLKELLLLRQVSGKVEEKFCHVMIRHLVPFAPPGTTLSVLHADAGPA